MEGTSPRVRRLCEPGALSLDPGTPTMASKRRVSDSGSSRHPADENGQLIARNVAEMLATVEDSARRLIAEYQVRAVFVAIDRLNQSIDGSDWHARDF